MQQGRTTWSAAVRQGAGAGAIRAVLAALRQLLLAERHRWALWAPVLMGLGVLLYMVPPDDPPSGWTGIALLVLAAATIAALRALYARQTAVATLTCLLAALPAGYLVAVWRTAQVDTISLARPLTLEVEGRVVAIEGRARGHRLTLDQVAVLDRQLATVPQRIRIGVAKGAELLAAGDRIRVRARLEAPQPPALPGSYDWARDAWFQGLGAVGWSLGAPTLIAAGAGESGPALFVERIRTALSHRIASTTPGAAGAVAAALVTGQRGAVDNRVWEDMQRSGLAHLISISGLHFTLVASVVFFLARWCLSLCPPLCLRLPAQKGAALAAILGCALYLVISGASVPAQRSFVTATIVFTAVLVDRDPISLRLLAVAAAAVLLVAPHSLLGPSFQLTFAAMVGLIALFEALSARRAQTPAAPGGPTRRMLAYLGGIVLTTVIATIATAPFGAWHFGVVATWGVAANMLAVPITSFVVMPAAVLGTALLPLGLDQPAFMVMGAGVALVLWIAAEIAAWPHASFAIPGMTGGCIALIVLGGLWLAIWQRPWRLLGLPPVLLGLGMAVLGQPPRLFVAPDAQVVAVLAEDGRLLRTPGKLDGRVAEAWRTRTGASGRLARWPDAAPGRPGCDPFGCTLELAGHRVAVLTGPGDAGDDCRHADLVLDLVAERRCPLPTRSIGRSALRAARGLEARLEPEGILLATLSAARGDRPWSRSTHPQPRIPDPTDDADP